MDAIQEALGQAMLVVIGIAVLFFIVIVVLVETDLILRLAGKLGHRWRANRRRGEQEAK